MVKFIDKQYGVDKKLKRIEDVLNYECIIDELEQQDNNENEDDS